MTTRVLLDTDIGSDIDDAICLAYLLANPACELMGITTVTGEAEKRARLASVLCKVAGKDVPIYPGAEQPLLVAQRQPAAPQAAALEKWNHEQSFPGGRAVSFLRETIRAYPGEINLLCIGPLTNIALVFALDPGLPALLKGLWMMCGVFTNRLAGIGPLEWNAMLDPHATAIVYHHAAPIHRSIGLDVTCQIIMERQEVEQRFQVALLRPVLDFAQAWFRYKDVILFHDPLAGACIFDPLICQFERGTVEVELSSPRLAGMTLWTADAAAGKHEAALSVQPQRFFDHFFSFFGS